MDLESFRRRRGLSQTQLAQELGLRSKGYISRIENRTQACPLRLALKIERFTEGQVTARSLCAEAGELLATAQARA